MEHRFISSILALLLSSAALGQTGDVTARAWVDSTSYQVGDAIAVHVLVTHPRGVAIQPPAGDSLGSLVILQHLPVTAQNDTVALTGLVVSYYDSGTVSTPPVLIPYAVPGDTVGRIAQTNPLVITVHTIAVDTSKAYRDLKPPLSIPISAAEIAMYAGIILAIAALGYFGYRYWKKRRERLAGIKPDEPARPADVLALEELSALKERKLWQKGMVKEYYSEVTEIIRRYFERRYGLRALEETTEEILAALRGVPVAPEAMDLSGKMLRLADLVKFAKFTPGIPDHEEMLTFAYDIVERTKPVVMSPVVNADVTPGS
ncbi:MAG: hypothetical protein WB699_13690 [Bacteroidota bacterium]